MPHGPVGHGVAEPDSRAAFKPSSPVPSGPPRSHVQRRLSGICNAAFGTAGVSLHALWLAH